MVVKVQESQNHERNALVMQSLPYVVVIVGMDIESWQRCVRVEYRVACRNLPKPW